MSCRTAWPPASRRDAGTASVFAWLARHVEEAELRRVFNLGIGYCAVVAEPGEDRVIGTIVAA